MSTEAVAAGGEGSMDQADDSQPDNNCRRIVREGLGGVTNREIADRLRCSLGHVERRLNLVRKLWEQVHE